MHPNRRFGPLERFLRSSRLFLRAEHRVKHFSRIKIGAEPDSEHRNKTKAGIFQKRDLLGNLLVNKFRHAFLSSDAHEGVDGLLLLGC